VDTPNSDKPEQQSPALNGAADPIEALKTAPIPEETEPGFGQLGLAPPIAQAVAELGYETPTPVQRRCIPHLLADRDLLGQAQTGTGKTAAFALPLLSRIDTASKLPQVLVLTPTRELALQVAEAFQRYAQHLKGFHVLPIYGGQSYGLQVRQLQRVPQVVVGTPGRIMDHMRRDTLSLGALKALVLDEADEMLNMGFAEDIDWIFEHTPPERQVALFAATMPPEILKVAREHLNDPVEVRVESATATVDTIDQQHCVVTRFHKLDVLTRLLELETFDGMLVFVRTKNGTTELVDKLRAQGFAAEPLNGDMNQEMCERTVERLKGGQLDILVATDVAARGLDVERVSHVVNFDIPTDPSAYVHRIGRTGRAGRAGKAILLVEPRERGLLRAIERTIRRPIPEMDVPSAAQLSASRVDRFTEQLRATLAEEDLDFFYRLVAHIAKEQELDLMAIAAALSFQLQRERPLEVKEAPRERRESTWRETRRDQADDRWRPQPRETGGYRDREADRTGPGRERVVGERPYRGSGAVRDDRGQGFGRRPERPDRQAERRPDWRPEQRPEQRPDRRFGREPDGGRPGDGGGYAPRPAGPRPSYDRPLSERERSPDERRQGGERDDRPFMRREPSRFPDDGSPRTAPTRDREERGPRPQRRDRDGPEMVRHRIEVGHRDGVTPREIVGAIANESGLEGRFIGAIDIQEDYSTVDLPAGMPRELFGHLKRVYVRGRPLRISVMEPRPRGPNGPPRDSADRGPRRHRSDEGGSRASRPGPKFPRKRRD
jgi:ATP-dependent RNA helicase DeaD